MAGWCTRARKEPHKGLRSRRCSVERHARRPRLGARTARASASCATPTTDVSTSRSERAGRRVMESITHYVEQRLKLQRQPTEVGGRSRGRDGPCLGFQFFRYARREDQGDGRLRRLSEAGQGSSPSADHAQLGRLDGAADQGDQPLHGRVDRTTSRLPTPSSLFEKLDEVAAPAGCRQVRWKEWKRPQTRYRNLPIALGIRDARSARSVGRVAEGLLARLLAPGHS